MADQTLNIDVNVQGAEAGATKISGVSKAVEGVGTATQETSKKTSGLRGALSGLATGFAVYKGAQFIKSAVNETTNLAKATAGLQRITGLDAQTAAGWVGIAKERGIESTKLNMGFVTLGKNLTNAAQNGGKSAQALAQMGIDAQTLLAVDVPTRMGMIADTLKAIPDPTQRAVLAQKLFGRQGQALLPILSQGAKGLHDQVGAMSAHMGMTKSSVKQSMELVKTQREWNATMVGVKVSIATALLPIMVELAKIITPIASAFATAMRGSGAFRIAVISLTAAITVFIVVAKALALAGIEVNAAWLLIPALIVGIGVALVMLYQKVGWFRNAVNAMGQAALAAFNWVKNAAIDAFNWIKNNWPLLVSIIGGPIVAVAVQVITHWHDIKNAAADAFNAVKSVASTAASVVGGAFKAAWDAIYWAIHGVLNIINQVISAIRSIASLPGKALGVLSGGVSAVGGAIGSVFQHGGYASHAGTALVGEAGPEMVHLPQGARVSPFLQSRSGGGTSQIHTHVYLDRRQIALAMGDYVAGQQAAR